MACTSHSTGNWFVQLFYNLILNSTLQWHVYPFQTTKQGKFSLIIPSGDYSHTNRHWECSKMLATASNLLENNQLKIYCERQPRGWLAASEVLVCFIS